MFNFLRAAGQGGAGVQRIAAKDAVARHAAGELVVIDVRDGMELRQGKAAGALHVPLMALKMKCDPASPECLKELSPDTPVALYCASGARSQGAAQMLAQMGYKEVYNLGGLYDWYQAGGAVERG
jgi:rhodanese-related sulfurtransferase